MNYVVMFSGGIASFDAARRIMAREGTEAVTCLFADTLIEDPDLYRFMDQTTALLNTKLVRLCDGRTPWEVFRDVRMIGNTRADPCSRILKRDLCDNWLRDNCDYLDTTVVLGLDWTETHRIKGARLRYMNNGWETEFPLNEPPWFDRLAVLKELSGLGIEIPHLYKLGFEHNNCGGFCIKAGQGHFAKLLRDLPEVYAMHEAEEEATRAHIGADVSILRNRTGGSTKPMTLKKFRKLLELEFIEVDPNDLGGCGCFST